MAGWSERMLAAEAKWYGINVINCIAIACLPWVRMDESLQAMLMLERRSGPSLTKDLGKNHANLILILIFISNSSIVAFVFACFWNMLMHSSLVWSQCRRNMRSLEFLNACQTCRVFCCSEPASKESFCETSKKTVHYILSSCMMSTCVRPQ